MSLKKERKEEGSKCMPGGLGRGMHVGEIVAHGPFVAMLLSGNLPDNLRQNPLYETQGLLESGFQLELLEDAFGRLLRRCFKPKLRRERWREREWPFRS